MPLKNWKKKEIFSSWIKTGGSPILEKTDDRYVSVATPNGRLGILDRKRNEVALTHTSPKAGVHFPLPGVNVLKLEGGEGEKGRQAFVKTASLLEMHKVILRISEVVH